MATRSRRRHIACDIDGVLADFVPAYATLCMRYSGTEIPLVADCWDWTRQHGMTPDLEAQVWSYIGNNPAFWSMLGETPECRAILDRLEGLSVHHSVYFVTNRPASAKYHTEQWLKEKGVEVPTVLITAQKGKLCQALGIDVAIDDKPENCLEMYRHLPAEARVYLLAAPYNVWAQEEWGFAKPERDGGIRVVESVVAALDKEGL